MYIFTIPREKFDELAPDKRIIRQLISKHISQVEDLEFGTGPKGQENHAGISPEITPAYTQNPWWIHESQVDRRVAEKYHWFYMDTPDGRFYLCTGQPAYPFMYPALKDSQDQILEGMKADFSAAIKESIK